MSAIDRRQLGSYYESVACDYLIKQGLQLIARNSFFKLGELDLIMKDKNCWVFVEVRFRRNAHFGHAASTVDSRKQQKLIRSAMLWLASQNLILDDVECRFDIFAITGSEQQWIVNAFGI